MTMIIQISAGAVLAAFASIAFVSTAQATHNLRVCNVTSLNAGDPIRRDCEGPLSRAQAVSSVNPGSTAGSVQRTQNFKSGNFYIKGGFKEGSNGGGGNGNGGNGGGGATGSSR